MKALKRTLADVAIEARMAVGTAPVWCERMGEGVEKPAGLGERSFDGDRSENDGHEDSFTRPKAAIVFVLLFAGKVLPVVLTSFLMQTPFRGTSHLSCLPDREA